MDHGSWINAAPRWDKELLSLSGVTYMLCLNQPQGIKGSSGASFFLKVTLYKKNKERVIRAARASPGDMQTGGASSLQLHSLALQPRLLGTNQGGGALISWHQNSQIRGKNWRQQHASESPTHGRTPGPFLLRGLRNAEGDLQLSHTFCSYEH